ncbi:MAG: aspartate carbamoyltransferase catalytic subunit [Clostridiales bacterium]|jgi:aspartate carbamoyltransferase catalytic subunit|nr:aspartate carbamoyltransferase catalytic subunit [Clostridiales bacterium]
MSLSTKDLLGLQTISTEDIELILQTAVTMKSILESNNKKAPHLQGKSIVTLFYENSTRTRLSFELASKYLSAASANIAASNSSVAKGETLIDTGRTIDRMGTDVIIIRHAMSGAPHLLAQNVKASVINAGDGMNEHPTQALLDMLTIFLHKGSFKGLRVAITGDILHSRVARSNIWGLQKMGADVVVWGPSTLMPVQLERTGAHIAATVDEAVGGADVVMGLRIQLERQKKGLFPSTGEYSRFFCVTEDKLSLAQPDCLLMHPGPVNRGIELSSAVIDSDRSVIDEQVTNGVAVRMALLYLMTRR